MSGTVNSGPLITAGNMMEGLQPGVQTTNPVAGPNIDYHGNSFPDVRYYPMPKDALDYPGVIPAVYSDQTVIGVNAIPSTAGTGNIAAAQGVTNGVNLTLVTGAATGISINVPFRQFNTGAIVTGAVVLDLGIETPTVVSANKTVTVADSNIYRNGQPIIITQVGNAAGTTHLFTYVTGLPTSTTITIADAPLASNSTTTRICSALPGWANTVGATPAIRPTFYTPYIAAGAALIFDASQAIERGVSITGNVLALGGNFTIKGADIYGQLQSEVVTVASGASTGLSKKTYKIIQSVTPSFTNTANTYSVNTQDLYGFPFRNDFWENLSIFNAGVFITSSTGWTKGDKTSPATTTTGDPRGTYSLQSPANGANRLVIYQTLPFLNLGRATPSSPQFLYGTTPV